MIELGEAEIENFAALYQDTVIIKENIQPADWYERKKILMPATAAIPGYVSYYNTPYWREPVNCISPDHPARDITIIGPAQDGKTFMVLEPMIGYTIECNPGNILHLTGNSELSPDASLRVDGMIGNCRLGYLIKPQYQKLKNNRTGDTAIRKEFPNGIYRVNSITKKNALRQNDIRLLLLDDADAAKKNDPKVGNLWDTAKGRTLAFDADCKRVCTTSPEIKGLSLGWEVFERSDQRHYYVPCPVCGELIELQFHIPIDEKNSAGLVWGYDNLGRVDPKSVGYICQNKGCFFTERNKLEWMNAGKWVPTCEPKELYHYGYKKSGLYSSPGMKGWVTLAQTYVACNPPGEPRNESKYQTFKNLMLGELYEPPTEELKAAQLLKNIRRYEAGTVPEDLSIKDGNGEIIMLTCAVDLNGVYNKEGREDDVRLDYEVVAWSASGATYSILHGSIGTFVFRETDSQKKIPREKWTYDFNKPNNVWRELDKVLAMEFPVSGSGRKMSIVCTAMDTGYCEQQAFEYIDSTNFMVFGIKGNPENKYKPLDKETKNFKIGLSRSNLYILDGHNIKEDLAACMRLRWDERSGEQQPTTSSCAGGFMNYPGLGLQKVQNGTDVVLYQINNYFSHYESEHRVEDYNDKNEVVGFVWKKKSTTIQNHFWDCRYYNIGAKEIFLHLFFTELKVKHYTWRDYVKLVLG